MGPCKSSKMASAEESETRVLLLGVSEGSQKLHEILYNARFQSASWGSSRSVSPQCRVLKIIGTVELKDLYKSAVCNLDHQIQTWQKLDPVILFAVQHGFGFSPEQFRHYTAVKQLWGERDFVAKLMVVHFTAPKSPREMSEILLGVENEAQRGSVTVSMKESREKVVEKIVNCLGQEYARRVPLDSADSLTDHRPETKTNSKGIQSETAPMGRQAGRSPQARKDPLYSQNTRGRTSPYMTQRNQNVNACQFSQKNVSANSRQRSVNTRVENPRGPPNPDERTKVSSQRYSGAAQSEDWEPSRRQRHQLTSVNSEPTENASPASDNELRILIIGNTGKGKSTLGNVLLDKPQFKVSPGMSSATREAQLAETIRDSYVLKVLDTPDIDGLDAKHEIARWKNLIGHTPDVILLAISCDVRYTPEEYITYQQIKELWGPESFCRRLIVAFTFGDCLDGPIEEELKTVSSEEKTVLADANYRFYVFDNSARKQNGIDSAKELLGSIIRRKDKSVQAQHQSTTNAAPPTALRSVLVIGPPGHGKSTLCNVLLGKELTKYRAPALNTAVEFINERGDLKVVDTPGINKERLRQSEVMKEIAYWKQLTGGEPYAILLAVRCDTPFTGIDHTLYCQMRELWGADSFCQRMILVFTFGDSLHQSINQDRRIRTWPLKDVLKDASDRLVVFDNSGSNKRNSNCDTVQDLDRIVQQMNTSDSSHQLSRPAVGRTVAPYARQEFRVLVLGQAYSGKTTLCNMLLDRRCSKVYAMTMTATEYQNDDGSLKVVDTPGFEMISEREAGQAVQNWKNLLERDPDAILLVVKVGSFFSKWSCELYRRMKDIWGSESFCDRLVLTITFGDRFRVVGQNQQIVSSELKPFVDEARGRFVIFDNSGITNMYPGAKQRLGEIIKSLKAGPRVT